MRVRLQGVSNAAALHVSWDCNLGMAKETFKDKKNGGWISCNINFPD